MKNIIIVMIILITFSSCKSIKKVKDLKKSYDVEKVEITESYTNVGSDMTVAESTRVTTLDTIEEEIITHQSFDSAGVIVFKPIIKKTKKTTSLVKEDSVIENDISNKSSGTIDTDSFDKSLYKDKDLEKSSEGMNVIEEAINGLTGGSWGKYVIGIIMLITSGLGMWAKFKKIKSGDNELE